jgi:hypothetical protein
MRSERRPNRAIARSTRIVDGLWRNPGAHGDRREWHLMQCNRRAQKPTVFPRETYPRCQPVFGKVEAVPA